MQRGFTVVAALGVVVALCACGAAGEDVHGRIQGRVFISTSPLSGVVVRARMVDPGTGKELLDLGVSSRTDAMGQFVFEDTEAALGVILLEVDGAGGTYTEPASNETIMTDAGVILRGAVTGFQPGAMATVVIDNLTTLGVALGTARHAASKEATLQLALDIAFQHLGAHFGDVRLGQTAPTDLTSGAVAAFDEAARYGVVQSGISELARALAEQSNLSPRALTTLSLTSRWVDDLDDDGGLVFDGRGASGALVLGACPAVIGCETASCPTDCELSGDTPRPILARDISNFLAVLDRNRSGISQDDAELMVAAIEDNDDPVLFSTRVVGERDSNDPVITVATPPAPGAYVKGRVEVTATIDDAEKNVGMGSLPLLDATLSATVAGAGKPPFELSRLAKNADGTVTLKVGVSTGPTGVHDGPLTVTFSGRDASRNFAVQRMVMLSVDNTAPVVTIDAQPWTRNPWPTVRGSVTDASPITALTVQVGTESCPVTLAPGAQTWSCTVTAALVDGPYTVLASARDAADNASELEQYGPLMVDTRPPVVNAVPSSMADELAMAVGFDPVAATPSFPPAATFLSRVQVVSGATLSKFVTKLGAGDDNPIVWEFNATADSEPVETTARYEISQGGRKWGPFDVIRGTDLTWKTPVTSAQVPDGSLETVPGLWSVKLQVSDPAGNAGERLVTWTHNPLGAPVEIVKYDAQPQVPPTTPPTSLVKLSDLNLVSGDAALAAATGSGSSAMALYRVRNGTNRAVNLAVFQPAGMPQSATYSRARHGAVVLTRTSGNLSCESCGPDGEPPPLVNDSVSGVTLTAPVREMALYDGIGQPLPLAAGGATACGPGSDRPCWEFTIPATTQSPTPVYWLAVHANLRDLWPPSGNAGAFSLSGGALTGRRHPVFLRCIVNCPPINPDCNLCQEQQHTPYEALASTSVAITQVWVGVRTRPVVAAELNVVGVTYDDRFPFSPLKIDSAILGLTNESTLP